MKKNTNYLLMLSLATFSLLELTNANSATAAVVAIKTTFCNPFFDGSRQVNKSWIEIDTELDDTLISNNCNVMEVEDEFVLPEIRTAVNSSSFGFTSEDEKKNGSDKQRNFLDDFVFWELDDDDNVSQNTSFLPSFNNIEDYKLSLLTEINLRLDRFSNWNYEENFQSKALRRAPQTASDEDIVVKSSIGSTVWGNEGLLSDNNTELEVSGGGLIKGNPFSLVNEMGEYLLKNDRSIDRVVDSDDLDDNSELEIDTDNDGINSVELKTDELTKNLTTNQILDRISIDSKYNLDNNSELEIDTDNDGLNNVELKTENFPNNSTSNQKLNDISVDSNDLDELLKNMNMGINDPPVPNQQLNDMSVEDSDDLNELLQSINAPVDLNEKLNDISVDSNDFNELLQSINAPGTKINEDDRFIHSLDPVQPIQIPEPTTMGGVILTGLIGIFTKYKKRQKEEK